jgi:Trk-type K+ transport system membrane component
LYLVGLIFLSPVSRQEIPTALGIGSALALDSRSAGLPLASLGAIPRYSHWMLIALMLIGAAPGSAGGGIKLTSIFHLWRGSNRALNRAPGPAHHGRRRP